MYPLKLISPLKDYIWGGTKLKTEFNINTDKEIVAESWELSCHKDGESIIENGEYAGLTLSDYINKEGLNVIGTNFNGEKSFPILIKLIDAKDNLSLQVHPDDSYAQKNEDEPGKTEMWYILDCEDGAEIIYGFKKNISKEEFVKRINDGTILDVVNRVAVKKGDVFFINSGTLHAIGKGIVIFEIQQNSNITYRVNDYNRKGADGNFRPLHINKATDVTDLNKATVYPTSDFNKHEGYSAKSLSACKYFMASLYKVDSQVTLIADKKSFHSVVMIDGNAQLKYNDSILILSKGDSIYVPANFGEYCVSGKCEFILSQI